MSTKRHKVFISYYHEEDQIFRDQLERLCTEWFDVMVSKSVDIGDIDPNANTEYVRQQIRDNYIADATVVVVLVGNNTWRRKHVDWEIHAGLIDTKKNPRCGLLGIVLPTHPGYDPLYPYTTPPRLHDNLQNGYANIYDWNMDPYSIQYWVDIAYKNRRTINPINSRRMFGKNLSGGRWQ